MKPPIWQHAPATSATEGKAIADVFLPLARGEQRVALLCFPYAGSGAATFGGGAYDCLAGVDLLAAQLPGRDGRLREPPFTDLEALVDHLAAIITSCWLGQSRLYLLGCSLGAVVAFELARALRRADVMVAHLIVAASRAPHMFKGRSRLHELPDDKFVQKIQRRYAAIPAQILANQEMLKLVLPTLRADLRMIETYFYQKQKPLQCPILALGGIDDRSLTIRQLLAWRRHTTAGFKQRMLPGDHFFVKQSQRAVWRTVAQQMET